MTDSDLLISFDQQIRSLARVHAERTFQRGLANGHQDFQTQCPNCGNWFDDNKLDGKMVLVTYPDQSSALWCNSCASEI